MKLNRSTRGYLKTNSLNGCDTRGQVLAKMTYGLKRLLLDELPMSRHLEGRNLLRQG
jgi:hypothetical protein